MTANEKTSFALSLLVLGYQHQALSAEPGTQALSAGISALGSQYDTRLSAPGSHRQALSPQ